jgi:hypothetical protein
MYKAPIQVESMYKAQVQVESNKAPIQLESMYKAPVQVETNKTPVQQANDSIYTGTETKVQESESTYTTQPQSTYLETQPNESSYTEQSYTNSTSKEVMIAPLDNGKEFTESVVTSQIKYSYEDDGIPTTDYFSCKRFEEFILGKGYLILEYFVLSSLCAFILVQLPMISETVMVYVQRSKYPIDVTLSSYKKTKIEKIKVERVETDRMEYENIVLDGFNIHHSLDVMGDTNIQQKSLAFYMKRQLSRLMYITKNIEIKPCLIMNKLFGFYDIYHVQDRDIGKEFYPVISLEILFSKTFMIEQNLPVFYRRFYTILNQSNVNKLNSLQISLAKLIDRIQEVKQRSHTHTTLEDDQTRVKQILSTLNEKDKVLFEERKKPATLYDPVGHSYQMKRVDEDIKENERRRNDCNKIYMEIKREYDNFVFENEISAYELYDKISDVEELLKYLK